MGVKLGPRVRIEWRARIGKKEGKAYSYVPKTIATKLGLKESASPTIKKTDVIRKGKKGARYPVAGSQGIGTRYITVDFGEKTPKGNPKYVTLRIPRGTGLVDVLDELAGKSKAQRLRYPGNKYWYTIPGSNA